MIVRLAHVEVGVQDLDRAREFYVDVLGFQEAQRSADALHLRAAHEFDVWSLKLTRADGPGMLSAGFRVSSPEDLESLAATHRRLGLRHAQLPAGFEPGRGRGLRVTTPSGHVIDFHHEIDEIDVHADGACPRPPMRTLEASRGVPPTEIDHINLRVPDLEESIAYWTHELQFSIAEVGLAPDGSRLGAWMRRTRTTHDVACVGYPTPGMHHFAYLVVDGASMIRTADLLGDAGYADALQFGPGRHGATNALAMYFLDPDGNRIEFYCGDYHRDLDRPAIVWSYDDFNTRGRFWWGRAPKEEFAIPSKLLEAPWPQTSAAGV
ncbi:MAG: nahC [Conexibacter sp.]|nr:nahC [Conexibacter sp.]